MGDTEKIDPSSPYYLGSGHQPGNLITRVLLRSDNYLTWSRAISLALKSRRKFVFIDGTTKKPTDEKKIIDWDTVNSMIVSWILRSMEPKLAATIPYFEEAKTLWDYLAKRFCVANGPRLQQLRSAILECKQLPGMSVEDYFNSLMGLYDDLYQLKPLHHCSCGLCTCNVVGKFEKDREEEQYHQFLIGINDDMYAVVRTNLLSRVPTPSLDEAYLAFTQEERSRGIARGKAALESAPTALQVDRNSGRTDRIDKTKLKCSHCNYPGHEASTCFKLHGYPEWWEDRTRKSKAHEQPSAARGRGPTARANAVLGHNTAYTFPEFFGFTSPFGGMHDMGGSRSTASGFNRGMFGGDDIFASFFGAGGDGTSSNIPRKAPPIERNLPCSLEDLYKGNSKKMKISRDVIDSSGRSVPVEEIVTIEIKPGWKKGTKITFPDYGNEQKGVIPADIVFIVDEKPHGVFKRDGNDLVVTLKVSLLEALTGYTAQITTLDNRNLSVPINPIISPSYEEVVKGEGMPIRKEPGRKGNLRIKFI